MGRISPSLDQPLGRSLSSPLRDESPNDEHHTVEKMERSISTDRRLGLIRNQTRRQETDHAFIQVGNYDDDWTKRVTLKQDVAVATAAPDFSGSSAIVPGVTPVVPGSPGSGGGGTNYLPGEPGAPGWLAPITPNPYPYEPYPGQQWVGPGGWESAAALQAAHPYWFWQVSPRNFNPTGLWYVAYRSTYEGW